MYDKYYLSEQQIHCNIYYITLNIIRMSTRKVLWIGYDGCRPTALSAYCKYVINDILPYSSFSFDCYNEIPISSPCWISLITEALYKEHKIGHNVQDLQSLTTKLENKNSRIKDICYKLNEAGKTSQFMYCGWSRISNFFHSSVNKKEVKNEKPLHKLLSSTTTPDFIFYYDSRVDNVGHHTGFSLIGKEYVREVKKMDKMIEKTVELLKYRTQKYNEEWLLVLLTDHGGSYIPDIFSKRTSQYKEDKDYKRDVKEFKKTMLLKQKELDPGEHGVLSLLSHRRYFQIYCPISKLIKKQTKTFIYNGELLPPPDNKYPTFNTFKWFLKDTLKPDYILHKLTLEELQGLTIPKIKGLLKKYKINYNSTNNKKELIQKYLKY